MRTRPRATYRVQLRREFDFDAARETVPYLAELGISHLYCSPLLQAATGSAHGYDVVDPTRVSEELGGDAGLKRLDAELRRHGMGLLVDIVPNHMCIASPLNASWWDVLRHGRASRFATWFDIDWEAPGLEGRVLLPVLGDDLARVLERGELEVAEGEAGDLELRYFEQRFPLAAATATAPGEATAQLLAQQHFLLEHWRSGLRRVNYRRFFDVSSLAGVRVEEPWVYEATHERIISLVRDGVADGVRVDHVDGLRDPEGYLQRLRSSLGDEAWIVVEKILASGEELPPEWPVDGTTGYEVAALLTLVALDGSGAQQLVEAYPSLSGDRTGFMEQELASRRLVLEQLLESELDRLARAATAAAGAAAKQALAALLAAMPVYRLYPRAGHELSQRDAALLRSAAATARRDAPEVTDIIDNIVELLQGGAGASADEVRLRFQQLSAATTAKGVEDTAFYRYVPLVSLDEVGGDPGRLGLSAGEWQEAVSHAPPLGLTATATHDTKRGEDARVRVSMLAEMPERWIESCQALSALGTRHRGERGPSPAAELLLYQTLVAAHPIGAARLTAYMQKAVREAKQETSWLDPDPAYEEDLERFTRAVLEDADMITVIESVLVAMTPSWYHSALTQTLLKLVLPGVADIYQGCELWDLRLVDPDNRGPVDYAMRRAALVSLESMDTAAVLEHMAEGLPKLHLIRMALALRRRRADAFSADARCAPLAATGAAADHVLGIVRGDGVAGVGVLRPLRLAGRWCDTAVDLPPG
ncbi:MAG: malto-oligosyltrehalose synthase, partial [Candidatus Dormibacteraeota bacterium]|nr:malto-oligosyltrehalose synthase [Candidatus Dormibacteraeota bacterium]